MDMRKVIIDDNGTGKAADPLIPNAIVFGKTGTEKSWGRSCLVYWLDGISWEELPIVVLLENSGSGGAVAAPVAKNIFEKIILFLNLL